MRDCSAHSSTTPRTQAFWVTRMFGIDSPASLVMLPKADRATSHDALKWPQGGGNLAGTAEAACRKQVHQVIKSKDDSPGSMVGGPPQKVGDPHSFAEVGGGVVKMLIIHPCNPALCTKALQRPSIHPQTRSSLLPCLSTSIVGLCLLSSFVLCAVTDSADLQRQHARA